MMFLVIPSFTSKGVVYQTTALILINVFSEIMASIILIFFLPKKFTIKKIDLNRTEVESNSKTSNIDINSNDIIINDKVP